MVGVTWMIFSSVQQDLVVDDNVALFEVGDSGILEKSGLLCTNTSNGPE